MTDQTSEGQSPHSADQAPRSSFYEGASTEASPIVTPTVLQPSDRRPEELHLPQPSSDMQQGSRGELPRQHSYHSAQEYGAGAGPGINVQQATPHGMSHSNAPSGSSLPGALQPGRPSVSSMNTSPAAVPTLPQISTQPQQYGTPARSSVASHSHSYSRSSPAGLDQQKYAPFVNTPENNRYASTPSQRYTSSQTPQGVGGYSPLGLADIRPMSDDPASANPFSGDGYPSEPTNSNYLAPWAIYSYDWCKWPVPQQSSDEGAGKMAIGSYVEDGHNFVRPPSMFGIRSTHLRLDPNSRHSCHRRVRPRPRCAAAWNRVHQDCRSDAFLSCHTYSVGAGLFTEAIHRSPSDIRRSSSALVPPVSTLLSPRQLDNSVL